MKTFLVFSWLLFGGAGWAGYQFYQQFLADKADLQQSLQAARQEVTELKAELVAKTFPPAVAPVATASPTAAPPAVPSTIPDTIITLTGKTYTGCILSRVTPDGISFTHAAGVAKVPFTELDPAFGIKYGYDPEAAKQYAAAEQQREYQSDQLQAHVVAADRQKEEAAAAAQAGAPANAPVSPRLSDADRQAIQAKISSLTSDVSYMQGEEAKVYTSGNDQRLKSDSTVVTHGGYADKIVSEQAEILQLRAQLN